MLGPAVLSGEVCIGNDCTADEKRADEEPGAKGKWADEKKPVARRVEGHSGIKRKKSIVLEISILREEEI